MGPIIYDILYLVRIVIVQTYYIYQLSSHYYLDMTFGEFLHMIGTWLLDEPVYSVLILVLGILNILIYMYVGWKQWSVNARLLTIELQQNTIREDIRIYRIDMGTMKSELQEDITATRNAVKRDTNA